MKSQQFIQGIRDGIPICLGYFSVSMAFGMTAVQSGLPLWSAVLMSITNVTSAGQFAGANILIACGGMAELIFTMLIINARYFLMSLSVSQKVNAHMSLWQRMAVSFGITDEVFAVSMQRREELTAVYMAGLILTPVIGWTMGTLVGAVATSFMPQVLSNAMGIALYGMFIAIIVPPAKDDRSILVTVILAIMTSIAFAYVPLMKDLSDGWSTIIITVVVSSIAATLFPIDTKDRGEHNE